MNCSKCQAQLPLPRKPVSLGQLLLGGWTCPHCHRVLDHQGREIVGEYQTGKAALLLVLLFGGIGLSNYLAFWAGRSGFAFLTLIVTLAVSGLGSAAIQPKTRLQ
ncbi:MAG: hypothetical protein HYR56_24595 [Acidobacteria bacterium]|nr:hypothetical protein [Acidobacteriota bacterium]MBI3422081.1 hypothetical protein [Acidobacteriota bacterium]